MATRSTLRLGIPMILAADFARLRWLEGRGRGGLRTTRPFGPTSMDLTPR